MSIMITAGAGLIRSHLAFCFVEKGRKDMLFDVELNAKRLDPIREQSALVQGDLSCYPEVMETVSRYDVVDIFYWEMTYGLGPLCRS